MLVDAKAFDRPLLLDFLPGIARDRCLSHDDLKDNRGRISMILEDMIGCAIASRHAGALIAHERHALC